MSSKPNRQFVAEVDADLLEAVRSLAEAEGRSLEAVVEEALTALVDSRRHDRPRAHVMEAYEASHARFTDLYKKLAE